MIKCRKQFKKVIISSAFILFLFVGGVNFAFAQQESTSSARETTSSASITMNYSELVEAIKSLNNKNNDWVIALLSALLGAIVGSVTGYYFNRQLEKQKLEERYWIQRKNTIYSVIYKKLLLLEEYLEQRPEARWNTYLIDVVFDREARSFEFSFTVWEEIKKDIRLIYVPYGLRGFLNDLSLNIKNQMELQETIRKEFKRISEEIISRNNDKLIPEKIKGIDIASGIYNIFDARNFSHNEDDANPDSFVNDYVIENSRGSVKKEIESEMKKFEAGRIPELKHGLNNLIEETKENIKRFDKLITGIISKYEGGSDI